MASPAREVSGSGAGGVGGYADRHCARGAYRGTHRLDGLQPEACPVLEGPPVGIGAFVVVGREELGGQVAVPPVHVDDVEADVTGSRRRLRPGMLDGTDVGEVHLLGHVRGDRGDQVAHHLGWSERRQAGLPAVRVDPCVVQVDAGERTVGVDLLGHLREGLGVPGGRCCIGGLVGLHSDRRVLGADCCPSSLGLDPGGGPPDGMISGLRRRPSPPPLGPGPCRAPAVGRSDPRGREPAALRVGRTGGSRRGRPSGWGST